MQKATIALLGISIAVLSIAVLYLSYSTFNNSTNSIVNNDSNNASSDELQVIDSQSDPERFQGLPNGNELTGNLTVYMFHVDLQKHDSTQVIGKVLDVIGYIDAAHYTDLGASVRGQYNIEGETKKPAESVKFYIDNAVVKPDGSPITRADIGEYYLFGNGISCCGFILKDGTDVGNAVIIVTDWAYDGYMMEKMDDLKKSLGADERATITIDVAGEPEQSLIESGADSSLMTMYLPVTISQMINLTEPTERMTINPIFADWDGIVRGEMRSPMLDEDNEPIRYMGFSGAELSIFNATCKKPYFIKIMDSDMGEDGIRLENSITPVSSIIYWGDSVTVQFNEPQSGIITYRETGYGIVPADYNNNNENTYRNNGAGNQEISGIYHLSFTSFYPAKVNLPEQAESTSFLEVKCGINVLDHVEKSDTPSIFVYDVWFNVD